jgi:hypothetical protein
MSTARSNGRRDAYSERIHRLLRDKYLPRHPRAEFAVYRASPANVHIRILDPDFRGVDIPERDDMAWEVLDELPDEVVSDISVVLLLPPEERDAYQLSREFDTAPRSRVQKNA